MSDSHDRPGRQFPKRSLNLIRRSLLKRVPKRFATFLRRSMATKNGLRKDLRESCDPWTFHDFFKSFRTGLPKGRAGGGRAPESSLRTSVRLNLLSGHPMKWNEASGHGELCRQIALDSPGSMSQCMTALGGLRKDVGVQAQGGERASQCVSRSSRP